MTGAPAPDFAATNRGWVVRFRSASNQKRKRIPQILEQILEMLSQPGGESPACDGPARVDVVLQTGAELGDNSRILVSHIFQFLRIPAYVVELFEHSPRAPAADVHPLVIPDSAVFAPPRDDRLALGRRRAFNNLTQALARDTRR